jgi:L-threonylcarbamoyladenylate synthase
VTQPVSALFPTVNAANAFVTWNVRAEELAVKHLPGPLTLILPLRDDAPATLLPTPDGGMTIGVRVSSHPVALSLAQSFGGPLSTTSANLHGQPNPYAIATMLAQFADGEAPDLILDSGMLPQVPPSTVIDLTGGEGEIRRAGTIRA